jgi:hypothetical protein
LMLLLPLVIVALHIVDLLIMFVHLNKIVRKGCIKEYD